MSEIIPIRSGEELELPRIKTFLQRHIPNLQNGELKVRQFSAGRSNLTYLLTLGDWEAVLRRPPLGPVAPKAHDMEREFTILKEIHPYYPPAPKPLLFADEQVIGSPFFIMERKRGVVLDTGFPSHIEPTKELGHRISEKMVDALVTLHDIDYKKTKLKDMSKHDGFLERQVHGWIKRFEKAQTEEIQGMDILTKWLVNKLPKSPEPTIIHYDFKLNNSMFDSDFKEVVGIFDWEMTTVGDPLTDLGVTLSYWIEENDPSQLTDGLFEAKPITTYPGFMTRNEFVEAYAKKSGREISDMHYYLVFSYFKLAGICQQIFYRWKNGQTEDERFSHLNVYVKNVIEHALELTTNKKF